MPPRSPRATSLLGVLLLGVFLLALAPVASAGNAAPSERAGIDQFIVKFKEGSPERRDGAARQRALDAGAAATRRHASPVSRMGIGADVVRLDGKVDAHAAEAFMNRLRRNPNVAWVQVDRILKPTAIPSDPLYFGNQWHYYEPAGGVNLPPAWDLSTGAGVVVGVIDTGITNHPDLDANIVPGYDFVTLISMSNDGNARDSDPHDPGDFVAAGECGTDEPAEDSSWHGTHVSGTVAAVTNNGIGVAGVAYKAKVMPLRALGKCGGRSSDIDDAIFWAAGGTGLAIPATANPNPVEVLNLSLGGPGLCSDATQESIDFAVSKGVVVVVSAGNDNADAAGYEPANCGGVVVVGATGRSGAKASYSNFGASVDVSAPGGDGSDGIASTVNVGTTVPAGAGYAFYQGTSMAAPHVAGVVALMQSVATTDPASVEAILKSTSRALEAPCPQLCGAGIVNAAAAIGKAEGGALTIDDKAAYEGNAGNGTLTFRIGLSRPMPGPVSFNVATANGSATAGADYVAVPTTAKVIPAGQTGLDVTVTLLGDAAIEADETFSLNVTNVLGVSVADGTGAGRILNDDPIVLANGVPTTLAAGAGQSFLHAIDVPAGSPSLTITTAGGTGDADLFVRRAAIPTTTANDCVSGGPTANEICTFAAPAAGRYYIMVLAYSAISNVVLKATYASPAPTPTISIADASVSEGNSGTRQLSFAIQLSSPAPTAVNFDVVTEPGTASPGSDYVGAEVTAKTIAAGASSATFALTVPGDTVVEDNETLAVELVHVSGATLADARAQGRIVNDDLAQLRIGDVSVTEGNSGTRTASFAIVLSAPMPSPVTFDIATSNGSAAAGSDYVARSQSGRYLDAGRTQLLFDVAVKGDGTAEGNETFNVGISNISGAVLADGTALGTIVNDDAASLVAAPVSAQGLSATPLVVTDTVQAGSRRRACRPAARGRGRRDLASPACTAARGAPMARRTTRGGAAP